MISPEFFEVIRKRLCPELKRYIFQYIDIETRIQMLLENRPYFATGSNRLLTPEINANQKNPLVSLLSGAQLTTVYREGWLKQLYGLKGSMWFIKPELLRLCPNNMIITPKFGNGPINLRIINEKSHCHPVVTTLNNLRKNVKMNSNGFNRGWSFNNRSSIPTAALSLLLNTDTHDCDINYYLRKKGFRLLIAMIKLINRTQSTQNMLRETEIQICIARQEKIAAKEAEKQATIVASQEKNAAKEAKKQAGIVARQEKNAAKEAKKQAGIVARQEKNAAKEAKKQAGIVARQEKTAANEAKKQAGIVARQEKTAAKEAKKQAGIVARQKKVTAKEHVVQQRRYRLNIIE
jgi:hypothetical protein